MASNKPHVQIRRIYEDPTPKTAPDAGRQNSAEGMSEAAAHLDECRTSEAAVLAELVIR